MKNIYKQYAQLKAEENVLKAKIQELQLKLIDELESVAGNKLETDYATFSLMGRQKWQYSKRLVDKEKLMKDAIKVEKKKEELNGTAQLLQDSWTLRCQLVK